MEKNKVYWTTKEGHIFDVDSMDEQHVRNAFKMLVNQLEMAKKAKCVEETRVELNGDMANEFNDSHMFDEFDTEDDDSMYEIGC
jgi:hypothetical protein